MAKQIVHQVINGEPTVTKHHEIRIVCCDCGLTHMFRIAAMKDEFVLISYRDDFLTQLNRKRKKKVK